MVILIFFLALVLLVLVHELGHFFTAKLLNMKVEEFGFGFPPRLFGFKKGETLYSFNLLPLGGFVRILGEEGDTKNDPRSYASRPAWQRSVVLISGVAMNFFLAVLIFWVTYTIGFPMTLGKDTNVHASNVSVQIVDVAKGSPASIAGLRQGEQIVSVRPVSYGEATAVTSVEILQNVIEKNKGNNVMFTLIRDGTRVEKEVAVRLHPPTGEGATGIILASVGLVRFPWYEAFGKAIITSGQMFYGMLHGLALFVSNLLWSGNVIGDISGPVGIASMVGQFYQLGFSYLLAFLGFISINLSVLNILPIPALDGGRLFFVGVEKLKGSPLKAKTEQRIHAAGFALLLSLIVLITIRDIMKL
ncbi:MAG: site-2 protease family protein [Candidatus Colwellbacteria bacterium]|nr:site-2 protease family protein [Candidatus Colwellbacteria bacterium]